MSSTSSISTANKRRGELPGAVRTIVGMLAFVALMLQGGCMEPETEFYGFGSSAAIARRDAPDAAVAEVLERAGIGLEEAGLAALAADRLEQCDIRLAWTSVHVAAGYEPEMGLGPDPRVLTSSGHAVVYAGLDGSLLKVMGTVSPRTGIVGDARFLLDRTGKIVWYMEVPLDSRSTWHRKRIRRALNTAMEGPTGLHVDAESFDGTEIHCLQVEANGVLESVLVINPEATHLLGAEEPQNDCDERLLGVSDLCKYVWAEVLQLYFQEIPD